ncbi:MAG: 4,5-DOPA dioxygenase extradiol [Betaproteobacteria bacterium]|nr:4,5-DOPA dioxygenase extradiol [Betaproteobacteria bacterium]
MKNNVIFIGHGNPIYAITPTEYTNSWKGIPNKIQKPSAIICVSAHWITHSLSVTAMDNPPTIHDFSGFPKQLYDINYPAKGDSQLAKEIGRALASQGCTQDLNWGLDHGAWSVLIHLYPEASIPVVQLSLQKNKGLDFHIQVGKLLSEFRDENILLLASGNSVHNLYAANWQNNATADPKAIEFDGILMEILQNRDERKFISLFEDHSLLAKWAHPTVEHLLPLFVAFGASDIKDELSVICQGVDMSTISMLSLMWSS